MAGLTCSERNGEKAEYFDIRGKIKFFSKKSNVIALHRPAIEYTKGRWPFRTTVRRFDKLTCGDGHLIGDSHWMRTYDKLREIEIPPDTWIVIEKVNTPSYSDRDVPNCTIWFVADNVEGKRMRWRIGSLDPLIAVRKKELAEQEERRKEELAK